MSETPIPAHLSGEEFDARVRFVTELAKQLHTYGTSAFRLEGAIGKVCRRLALDCNIWSNPTGMILSFSAGAGRDPRELGDFMHFPERTLIVRLEPGGTDLGCLAAADGIAEEVVAGRLDAAAGYEALRVLARSPPTVPKWVYALTFAPGGAAVAALLRGGWAEIAASAGIGLLIGLLWWRAQYSRHLAVAFEALAALVAAFIAVTLHVLWTPLALTSVLVSSLIVLMPGMTLTTAVTELATQHLASGTARFAGAMTSLFKLAFGTAAGLAAAHLLVGSGLDRVATVPAPAWVEPVALLLAAAMFGVQFKAAWRDLPLVMGSAVLGYSITRIGGAELGAPSGVFLASLVVGSMANIYARWRNRPGALVRVPGIILSVPGSVGFRTLILVFGGNLMSGLDTAVTLLLMLAAVVGGLIFGNLLVPPRRYL